MAERVLRPRGDGGVGVALCIHQLSLVFQAQRQQRVGIAVLRVLRQRGNQLRRRQVVAAHPVQRARAVGGGSRRHAECARYIPR
jgi:hypothetical protein